MTEPDSPLEPRVVALLREEVPPGPEARDRVRAKLAAHLGAAGGRGSDGGHGHGGGTGAAGAGGSVLRAVSIATAAFLVGGATGAAVSARLIPPAPPTVVYVPQPIFVPVAAEPAPSSSAEAVVPPAAPAPALPGTAHASPSASASSSASAPSRLAAERALLDEARSALVHGDAGHALERLERHRRTFPVAVLGEERDAMEVEALVKAGRFPEARAKADAFRRRSPSSLFLPVVESAIASIP